MNSINPQIKLLIVMVIVIFALMMLKWRTRNFDYKCKICGARFELSYLAAIMSMHMMGKRFVKCPHCRQWCWANPIRKGY